MKDKKLKDKQMNNKQMNDKKINDKQINKKLVVKALLHKLFQDSYQSRYNLRVRMYQHQTLQCQHGQKHASYQCQARARFYRH